MLDTLGTRSADDKISRVVRITLGGQSYELPVRSIRANREWKDRMNAATAALLMELDPAATWAEVAAVFDGHEDELIDLLVSYDTTGQLSRDLIETIEPDATIDLLRAVREVGQAASPLVVIGAQTAALAIAISQPSEPTSSSPPPTAGRRRKSRTN